MAANARTVTASQFAGFLGIGERHFRRIVAARVIRKQRDGRYDLQDGVQSLVRYWRDRARSAEQSLFQLEYRGFSGLLDDDEEPVMLEEPKKRKDDAGN